MVSPEPLGLLQELLATLLCHVALFFQTLEDIPLHFLIELVLEPAIKSEVAKGMRRHVVNLVQSVAHKFLTELVGPLQ